jgi:uncharacterized protein
MDKTSYLPGKFIWFEYVTNDIQKARAFYEPLFGWHAETMPLGDEPYHMLLNGEQGIGGLTKAQAGEPNHWLSYMSTASVDEGVKAATAAGAKVTMPPTDFTPVGRGAGLTDPTGAAFCLWTSAKGDEADGDVPVGGFVWNELSTTDIKKAIAFYEKAFGYTHDEMEMGEHGLYYILKTSDGKGRAGAFQPKTPMPTMWLPYVHVADCDGSVAKAQKLGAPQVVVPPTDIPGVGRFAIVIDPQGAPIAMLKPQPMD